MIRPAHGAAAGMALALLLACGCGDGSPDATPTPTDPRIPTDFTYYFTATIVVPEPSTDPRDPTVPPIDCNGTSIPPGTVFVLEANDAAGGLIFGAERPTVPSDHPFGNPTFVSPILGGQDRISNLFAQVNMPNIPDTTVFPDPPVQWDWKAFGRGVADLDPFCVEQSRVAFGTEGRDCEPVDTDPDVPDCLYGTTDTIELTDYIMAPDANGERVFLANAPIEGRAHFVAQAKFRDSVGAIVNARVVVDLCFRFPGVSPESNFPPTPMPCP